MSDGRNAYSKLQNLLIKKEGGASVQSPRPLRAGECPTDMVYQIGGWSSINSAGSSYGHGFNLEIVTKYVLR